MFRPDNNIMSSVGWTETGRVETQRNSESMAKIKPMNSATLVITMELHEFQGAMSLPNVVLIKYVFLKITKSNLTYPYPTNIFFLVRLMHEKKPSAHMVLKLTTQSIR